MTNNYRQPGQQDIKNNVLIASLFWENKTYGGYCIRLSKVDLSTMDFSFDSEGELDWDAIDTWRGTDAVTVSIWYDQSGYGNDLYQISKGSQPVLDTVNKKLVFSVSSSSNLKADDNGSLDLDGHGWSLGIDAELDGYNNQGGSSNAIIMKGSVTSSATSYGLILNSSDNMYLKTGLSDTTTPYSPTLTSRKTWIGVKESNGNTKVYENNTQKTANTNLTANSDTATTFYVGRDLGSISYIDMSVYKVFLYKNKEFSDTEREYFNS